MRAWTYWLTIGLAVVAWGAVLLAGREGLRSRLADPVWLAILLLPIAAAGVNLIAFRASHEEVCRIELQRHPWLRVVAGRGYSARAFALTGVALLAAVPAIPAAVAYGR